MLLFHGDRDEILPVEASATVDDRGSGELVVLPGTGHLMADVGDLLRARMLSGSSRCFQPDGGYGHVVVVVVPGGGVVDVVVGDDVVVVDVGRSVVDVGKVDDVVEGRGVERGGGRRRRRSSSSPSSFLGLKASGLTRADHVDRRQVLHLARKTSWTPPS